MCHLRIIKSAARSEIMAVPPYDRTIDPALKYFKFESSLIILIVVHMLSCYHPIC